MKTLLAVSLMLLTAAPVFYIHAEDETCDVTQDTPRSEFKITVTEHDGSYTIDEFNKDHEMMLEFHEIRHALDLASNPKNPNEKFTKAVTKHVFVGNEDFETFERTVSCRRTI